MCVVVVILLVSVDVTVVVFVITVVRFVDRRWLSWLLVFVGVMVVIRAIIVDVDVLVFVVIAGISRCAWCFVALRQKQLCLHYNLRIKNKLKNIEWEEEMHAPFELDDEDVEDAPMVEDVANAGVGMIEDAA